MVIKFIDECIYLRVGGMIESVEDTYEEFEATKGTLEVLKPKMQAFVNRCYERYEEIMQIYLEAPERFKTK